MVLLAFEADWTAVDVDVDVDDEMGADEGFNTRSSALSIGSV
jgi:hypothetical protein